MSTVTTLASPAVGASVRDASAVCVGVQARAGLMDLQGTEALVFHRLDAVEVRRRRDAGAGRLDRLPELETLLQLPVGVPVAVRDLPAPVRAGILRLPAGAASVTTGSDRPDEVTRHAVRPLAVDLVVVRASGAGWRSGLERASRFAPFCARALLLDSPVARRDDLLMEADFYGIGVLLAEPGGRTQMVLQPEPYRPPCHTAGAWWFTEDVFTRLG